MRSSSITRVLPATVSSGISAIVDRVVADAADRDRAVALAPHRVLHRLLADLARLALVDVGDAADERALQVAEGVAAHALDPELGLDLLAQQVGQRAGAGELHVAVRVLLDVLPRAW